MRIVFDTNVLFAAQITRGTCAALYQEALIAATLLTSDYILNELEEKLLTKARMEPEEAARTRTEVADDCRIVTIALLKEAVCRDPDDDAVLATAVAAKADLLVTGDKDLLVLGSHGGIPIVAPKECLARLRA